MSKIQNLLKHKGKEGTEESSLLSQSLNSLYSPRLRGGSLPLCPRISPCLRVSVVRFGARLSNSFRHARALQLSITLCHPAGNVHIFCALYFQQHGWSSWSRAQRLHCLLPVNCALTRPQMGVFVALVVMNMGGTYAL